MKLKPCPFCGKEEIEHQTARAEAAESALSKAREALKSAVCIMSHALPGWKEKAPVSYRQIREAINQDDFFGNTPLPAPEPKPESGVEYTYTPCKDHSEYCRDNLNPNSLSLAVEALEESLALNKNWVADADSETLSYYSEYRAVIKLAEDALSRLRACGKGGEGA